MSYSKADKAMGRKSANATDSVRVRVNKRVAQRLWPAVHIAALFLISLPANTASFQQTNWGLGVLSLAADCTNNGGTWLSNQCLINKTTNSTGWQAFSSKTANLITANSHNDLSLASQSLNIKHKTSKDFSAGGINNVNIKGSKITLDAISRSVSWAATPSWSVEPNHATNSQVAVGDFDQDGDLDIMTAASSADRAQGYENLFNSSGENDWVRNTNFDTPIIGSPNWRDLRGGGDFNGDGIPDIAYGNIVYTSKGITPTAPGSLWVAQPTWPSGKMMADLDGDDDLERTRYNPANVNSWTTFVTSENIAAAGAGPTYAADLTYPHPWIPTIVDMLKPYAFFVDLDSDGDPDVVKQDSTGNPSGQNLFRNDGNGIGTVSWVASSADRATWLPALAVGAAAFIVTEDATGDELPDAFIGDGTGLLNFYQNTSTIDYHQTGSLTSAVLDAGTHAGFTTVNYKKSEFGGSVVKVELRAGSDPGNPGAWPVQWVEVASNGSLAALGNYRYVQYKVTLEAGSASGKETTPVLRDITINYVSIDSPHTLVSSWFNSQNTVNYINALSWGQTLTSGSDVRVQLQTAPDSAGVPGTATGWLGPNGTSGSYWNSANTFAGGCEGSSAVSCSVFPTAVSDGTSDQWFQYKVTLHAGVGAPTVADVAVSFDITPPAGMLLSKYSGLSTSEALTTDSFTVRLISAPSADVIVDVSTNAASEVAITSSLQLTFRPDNWQTPQTVSLVGVDDLIDDGDKNFTIILNPSSVGDAAYNALANATTTGVNANNDFAGVNVSSTATLMTSEAGGTGSVNVWLGAQPLTNVRVPFSVSNPLEGTVSPAYVIFTPSNWSTPQTVTVSGVNDFIDDGDRAYLLMFNKLISGDPVYHGIDPIDISVVNQDDDTKTVVVSPNAGLTTTEAGGSVVLSVRLGALPDSGVTVNLTSLDVGEGSLSRSSMYFHGGNWNQSQTVTLTGVDDALDDGDISYDIQASVTSADPAYNGLTLSAVTVTNIDNDGVGADVGFSQSRWNTSTPGNAVSCAAANGSWNGGECSAAHATNQSGWDTYSTKSSDLVVVNNGYDIQAKSGLRTLTHSLNKDFNPSLMLALIHTSDADFSTGTVLSNVAVTGNQVSLNNSLTGSLTSAAMNIGAHSGYGTLGLRMRRPAGTTLTVEVKAANDLAMTTNATAWLLFHDGDDMSALGTRPYVQYRLNFTSPSLALSPSVEELSINYMVKPLALGSGFPAAGQVDYNRNRLALIALSRTVSWPASATVTVTVADTYEQKPMIGDFDADGDMDILSAPYWGFGAYGYENIGSNAAPNWVRNSKWDIYDGAAKAYQLGGAGDMDGDGDPDILLDGKAWRNDGRQVDGSILWTLMPAWTTGLTAPTHMGDLDGDGKLDVIGQRSPAGSANIWMFKNYGVGEPDFRRDTSWETVTAETWSPWGSLADIDGNGSLELIDYKNGYLYRNDNNGVGNPIWVEITADRATWVPGGTAWMVTTDLNGDDMPDAITGAVGAFSYWQNTTTMTYPASALYDSAILDFGQHSGYGALSYNSKELGGSSLSVAIRAGNTATAPSSWPVQWTTVAKGGSLAAFNSYRYLQYRVTLNSGSGNSRTPILEDISIAYNAVAQEAQLTSSAYDTAATASLVSGLSWGQTLPANTDVQVQLRSAVDNGGKPGAWSEWLGPNGLKGSYWNSANTYGGGCIDAAGKVTCSVIPVVLRNGVNNRWLQYRITLRSDGAQSAKVSDITVNYATALAGSNVVITPATLTTSETGTSAVIDVYPTSYLSSLAVPANVEINFALSDPSEGRLSTDKLIFTPADPTVAKQITVYGVDDSIDDGNIQYVIYSSAAISSDAAYSNRIYGQVTVTNTDDETGGAAFIVTPTSGLTVNESGTTTSFTVTPATAPTANVTVDVVSGDGSEASVSPSVLTFAAGSTAAQTVFVTGKQDTLLDNNVTYTIFLSPAVSSDSNYDGLDPADVSVTTIDDETANIVVSGGPFVTTENGGMAIANIKLTSAPAASVTLTLASGNGAEGNVSPTTLTFTTTNWNTNKSVYIYGVNDTVQDGDVSYNIITNAFSSSDGNFNGINPQDIPVTNTDNDTPTVNITPLSGLETSEDGTTAIFKIKLGAQPTQDVIFNLVSGDPGEGSVPATFVITPANYNWTGNSISVAGVDDGLDDVDQVYTVGGTYSSADGRYASGTLPNVNLTNRSTNTGVAEHNQVGAEMGRSVAFADVNGDAKPDLIVGVPGVNSNTGRVLVYHGTGVSYAANFSTLLTGAATANYFGYSVANAGDLNNDGYDEVVVGAYGNSSNQGAVYVYQGSATGLNTTPVLTLLGTAAGDRFGFSVAGAGDVNGDGFADFIVGAYGVNGGQGQVNVYHGNASISSMTANTILPGNVAAENFGYAVAFAGNVDGLNYDDIIIGAPAYSNSQAAEGRAYSYLSTGASGLNTVAAWSMESDIANAAFGSAVAAAGDVDNDGYADVVVGAPGYQNGQVNEGAVYAYHGSSAGLSVVSDALIESNQVGALLGSALASAGDINLDGYSDVIAGAPSFDDGHANEGKTFIYKGSVVSLVTTPIIMNESNQNDANFGVAVAGNVDFDGNGYSDYAVGSNLYDNPEINEGRVYIYRKAPDAQSILILTAGAVQTSENAGSASFQVKLSSPPTADVVLIFSSDDVTEGTVTNSVLLFTAANWNTPQRVYVQGQDDLIDDGPITYNISTTAYSSDVNYSGKTSAPLAVTNLDDETTVTVVATDANAAEAGGDTATFTVYRTEPMTAALTVYYSMSGTATSIADYSGASGSVVIPAGQGSANITLTPVNDIVDENDETVIFTLVANAAYFIGGASSANAIIIDNDTTVSVSATDPNAAEAGLDTGTWQFFRTQPIDQALTVYFTISGTATSALDYVALPTQVTFSAGSSTAQLVITPIDDSVDEPNETVIVTLTASGAYSVAGGAASITIADDDVAGIMVDAGASVITNEAGSADSFSLVLTSQPSANVSIALSSNTPSEGRVSPASVVFTPSNWSVAQTVSVIGQDDQVVDGDQAYTIITAAAVSNDASYSGRNVADISATNLDDEALSRVSIAATVAAAAENAGLNALYTISRSGDTAAALTVNYTVSGTASSGLDYQALGSSVVIPATASSVQLPVVIINDTALEGDENIVLTLNSAVTYILARPTAATVRIIDEDQPELPIVNFALDQAVGDGDIVDVRVFLNKDATSYPVSIPFTVSGSATGVTDHNAIDDVIVITSGRSAMYTFDVVDDGLGDPNETVIFTLGTLTSVEAGARNTHTVTIVEENYAPHVTLSATQAGNKTTMIVNNGGDVTVTATVTDPNFVDSHIYDWSLTNNNLVDIPDANLATYVFTPAGLVDGFYKVRLKVTDTGTPALNSSVDLLLEVVATAPVLSASLDSDGDGIVDSVESTIDSDLDGIPDYLDNNTLASNELPLTADQQGFIMRTDTGLTLSLGETAFAAGGDGALVSVIDIASFGGGEGNAGTASSTDTVASNGDYYDFTITGLPVAGQSARVVIPYTDPLPAGAVYRKYSPTTGWRDFVENANNSIASAIGLPGECPVPGDASYVSGLIVGAYCVQLTIEDGGANDTDGIANNVIKDPGQIGFVPVTVPVTNNNISVQGSGGGSLVWWYLLVLVLVYLAKQVQLRAYAARSRKCYTRY